MASKAARLIYRHRQNFKDDEDGRLGSSSALSQQRLPRSAGTKRRRTKPLPRTHRTLAVLLESMRDYFMVFELKNETEVSGILYDVDANLNVNLVDAQLKDRNGRSQRLDTIYINGSTVRYVRLPDKVDAMRALNQYLDTRARICRSESRQKRAEPVSRELPAAPPIELPAPHSSRVERKS